MGTSLQPGSAKARIFLVDDHPVVRQGISRLVNDEPDLEICGEAENAADALTQIAALHPRAVILDITLKGVDGLELLRDIVSRWPTLPVLVLSMHNEEIYAERALRAGAKGYVMKEEAPDNVRAALRNVLRGEIYVSEKIMSRVLGKLAARSSRPRCRRWTASPTGSCRCFDAWERGCRCGRSRIIFLSAPKQLKPIASTSSTSSA